MKQIFLGIFLLGIPYITVSQESFRNFGDIKIHDNGNMGFHYNLINTGNFNDNLGLVGFYNSDELSISGSNKPVFNDMEVLVDNGLYYNLSVGVTNHLNFIVGDIIASKRAMEIELNFAANSFYSGQNNLTKVDGYASISDAQTFIFPIGDDDELRPLLFEFEESTANAQSAYFKESPEFSISLNTPFSLQEKEENVEMVSSQEFWQLKALGLASVTLSWNNESAIEAITDQVENLVIVGWNINNQQWELLGAQSINGNLNEGFVSSLPFNPNEYEILTFGSVAIAAETTDFGDYLISPNGDGNNDFLVIENIPTNNRLQIYNRYGALVFEQEDYVNEFNGVSTNRITLGKGNKLPAAVYFYVVTDTDSDEKFQGFLYLAAE